MAALWSETWTPNSWAASSWWQNSQISPTWTMPPPPPGHQLLRHAVLLPPLQQILVQLAYQYPQPSRRMTSTTTPTWSSSPPSERLWSPQHGVAPKDSRAWIFATLPSPTSADVVWKNMDFALFLMGDSRALFSPATSPRLSSSRKYKSHSARTTLTSTPPSRPSTSPKTLSRQTK